jgi:hypothetical protein
MQSDSLVFPDLGGPINALFRQWSELLILIYGQVLGRIFIAPVVDVLHTENVGVHDTPRTTAEDVSQSTKVENPSQIHAADTVIPHSPRRRDESVRAPIRVGIVAESASNSSPLLCFGVSVGYRCIRVCAADARVVYGMRIV